MRIAIIGTGSQGDVQPYIVLGKGLNSAGYSVRFVTHQNFENLVLSHGLEFWPIEHNVQETVQNETMRARGVPSVIVPFFGDQPFWGQRIVELGVGPDPIPHKKLTAGWLAEAIEKALTNEGIRRRAARLGSRIQAEDGIARAVEIITQIEKPRDKRAGLSKIEKMPDETYKENSNAS